METSLVGVCHISSVKINTSTFVVVHKWVMSHGPCIMLVHVYDLWKGEI